MSEMESTPKLGSLADGQQLPQQRRRYEQVVDSLLDLIDDRGLEPGEAMPTERELSEVFGVSRSVLRQAFGILEERGILSTRQGSGRYLREAKQPAPGEGIRDRMEIASIADVLEARALLETEIARLACDRRTHEEVIRLRDAASRLRGWEDNVTFHQTLASCTHNFMLERMIREQVDLASELHQRDHYNDPDQLKRMREEHKAIAAAVASRDGDLAAELVGSHLRGTNNLLS